MSAMTKTCVICAAEVDVSHVAAHANWHQQEAARITAVVDEIARKAALKARTTPSLGPFSQR